MTKDVGINLPDKVQGQIGTQIRNCLCNWFSEWSLTDAEILEITARLPDQRLLRIERFGRKSLNKLRELQRVHYGSNWKPPPDIDWRMTGRLGTLLRVI